MLNLIISIAITILLMILLTPIIIIILDSKIDKAEKKEVKRLQKQAFDSLHEIKVVRPKL